MHTFTFIHTSCFFGDFPAFFVGDPLSVLVKNPHFSSHVHIFPFINTSSVSKVLSTWNSNLAMQNPYGHHNPTTRTTTIITIITTTITRNNKKQQETTTHDNQQQPATSNTNQDLNPKLLVACASVRQHRIQVGLSQVLVLRVQRLG